ncbi:lysosome membrane protein 2a isoform X1 [Paramormyrops kingsleyae]|uniref:Scavenger receptor class B, member 2a n=1 Tax=Paramormyrops kingsleyae TaxID=1676925 RepID=A0A3B3QQY5_9TELE|nr:lysosome membrane protein 2-like isoform X1 [Paramormyrops kingsleyae]
MTRRSCTIYATGIVCAHLLIIGIALVLGQVFQTLIHNRLKKELTLAEGSRVIESWKNPPSDVYMQYFFFNVTNPEVFLAGGKAAVTQIGPYTYREYRPRENVTYLENGTKLFALNPKSFVFVPEMSSGDPEVDLVRTINIPFVATVNEMKNYNFMVRTIMSIWIKSMGVELFITRTVHEMLWGFKDPLMTKLHSLKPEVDEYFGLMYKKNGTHEGEFVFLTGEQNYLDYGKIDTWNGLRKMTWWSSNQSNMINGTDGSAFHPLLSKNELLYIFAADLCRSIHLGYVEDVVVEGISAYRFAPPMDVLASPQDNPANAGFCVPANDCLSRGVLKVSVCREGAPIVVSFPHFYQADQKYIDAIEGMRPSKEAHETYLDLNPTTGIPVRACKRAQLNVLLNRVSGFPTTRNLTQTIFPIMFVNESFVIDPNSAGQMRTLLTVVTVVSNFPLFIVGLGAILLVVFVILICRSRQKRNAVKRIEFSEAFRSFPNAKEDTAYTQVSSKPEEQRDGHVTVASQSLRNGSYISMSQVETPEC